MIPYGRQDISQDDIDEVIKVLNSDFLTQGPTVPAFERLVKNYCGARHAVAVNSATSALHIAYRALDIGPGDLVWTTPITFVATSNCALYCGAEVDFVDIDPVTFNLSPDALEKKLEQASLNDRLPSLVVAVHLSGQSCDMQAIHTLSIKYGFKIVEDASHAIGGKYKDEHVGSCQYSDITVFSFHPVKIVTTGEGGMALTNDGDLAAKMAFLRSHGITRYQEEMHHISDGPWYYEQVDLGFNYRLTDIQAALGISQMKRLDDFVKMRHSIATRYDDLLPEAGINTPKVSSDCYSSYHLYIIRVEPKFHKEIFERLRCDGVLVNLHYIPIYRHPYYELMGFNRKDFPNAEQYYQEAISLPIFPKLTEDEQMKVVNRLKLPHGHQTLF